MTASQLLMLVQIFFFAPMYSKCIQSSESSLANKAGLFFQGHNNNLSDIFKVYTFWVKKPIITLNISACLVQI